MKGAGRKKALLVTTLITLITAAINLISLRRVSKRGMHAHAHTRAHTHTHTHTHARAHAIGEFNKCGRCKQVRYHSRDCQVWIFFSPSPSSTHTHTRVHTHAHPHARTHARTYTRTHARTHTHTHTHTHARARGGADTKTHAQSTRTKFKAHKCTHKA